MKKLMMAAATAALVLVPATGALACGSDVTYRGQGLTADGTLRTERCLESSGTSGYMTWVLTASGASSATISGPWGNAPMTKSGNGSFKFVSGYYAADDVIGAVSASAGGKVRNAQLVISHGCSGPGVTIN